MSEPCCSLWWVRDKLEVRGVGQGLGCEESEKKRHGQGPTNAGSTSSVPGTGPRVVSRK